ncbi:hypothetical protein [Streptacidiphilus sp. MAP12-33]|uniref:hypothetical protein n=1 Tax=Streptacidiphilus sp. MAP12-33 TaxID=3156266 RepID=UPI003512490F
MGVGAAVGGFIILAVIGAIIGPQKTASTASTTSSPTAATTTPSTVPSPSHTPSPSATKTHAATPSASAPVVIPSSGPTYLAPASARHQAAAILRGSDAYYQQVFNDGVPVILDRGQPNSFPAFAAWQQAHGQGDVQEGMTAFKKADAFFNADDEPSTITDWQADNGTLSSDINELDMDGDGVGGPDDATYRAKVEADVTQFQKDFATAEKDAANVEGGR